MQNSVVANMFFIPTGLWHETPGVTVGLYIWKGIIPALLGNIVGGGLFVGTYFWYFYLQGADAAAIDGNVFDASPVGRLDVRSGNVDFGLRRKTVDEETLHGTPPAEGSLPGTPPNEGTGKKE